jgi:hypothetical protein
MNIRSKTMKDLLVTRQLNKQSDLPLMVLVGIITGIIFLLGVCLFDKKEPKIWSILLFLGAAVTTGIIMASILIYILERILNRKSVAIKIKNPPTSFLLKIANLLPEKCAKDLTQNISDMRLEYYEALSEKNIWRARFIVYSYYIGLSWSVVMWISDKVKEVVGLVPKKD